MLEPVDWETLQAAIHALKINVPVYSAIQMHDGSIQIITLNDVHTWMPPARKTQTPQRTRGKAHLSAQVNTSTGGTK